MMSVLPTYKENMGIDDNFRLPTGALEDPEVLRTREQLERLIDYLHTHKGTGHGWARKALVAMPVARLRAIVGSETEPEEPTQRLREIIEEAKVHTTAGNVLKEALRQMRPANSRRRRKN